MAAAFSEKNMKIRKKGFFIIELVVAIAILMIFIKGVCVLQGRLVSVHATMQGRIKSIRVATQVLETGQSEDQKVLIRLETFRFKQKECLENDAFACTVPMMHVQIQSLKTQPCARFLVGSRSRGV